MDDTISLANAAGFTWPLPADLDDEALELRLYPPVVNPASRKLPQPDWRALHDELAKHKKPTLMLLWQEYKGGRTLWLPVHLKEHNHRQRYYRLLTELMPDWEFQETRLDRLAETLLND